MEQQFYDAVEGSPVIAAVKDLEGLKICCALEDIKVVFLLFGDICTLEGIVKQIKTAGKIAMVHVDLISGLGSKEVAVDYVKSRTGADGIISTKSSLIKRAKELGMYTILRIFVIDSMALENAKKQYENVRPDFIEMLPGAVPKAIKRLGQVSKIPVIAGGLITDKEDVLLALDAGAISVSTTNREVWLM